MPERFRKMFDVEFWDGLWKFYLVSSIATAFVFLNKKWLRVWFYYLVMWIKEGIEDADGQLNSKDLWLAFFSVILVIMGFLEWYYQKEFSQAFWTIIGGLTGGGVVSKSLEEYFRLKNQNNQQK